MLEILEAKTLRSLCTFRPGKRSSMPHFEHVTRYVLGSFGLVSFPKCFTCKAAGQGWSHSMYSHLDRVIVFAYTLISTRPYSATLWMSLILVNRCVQ